MQRYCFIPVATDIMWLYIQCMFDCIPAWLKTMSYMYESGCAQYLCLGGQSLDAYGSLFMCVCVCVCVCVFTESSAKRQGAGRW